MIRRCFQLGLEGEGTGIRAKCLDDCYLGSVDVTLGAEVSRMASGTRSGHRCGSAAACQPAVILQHEAGRPVRLRSRKLSHVGSGEPNRLRERNVTGPAAAVCSLQMRRSNAMAIETVLGNGEPNLHPVRTWLHMARPAVDERIRMNTPHGRRVCAMSKAQIGGRWLGRRLPRHCLFDDPVVAGAACGERRPESLRLVSDCGMAAGAAGKKLAVLPVIETIPHLRLAAMNQTCDGQDQRDCAAD
jgi:hypothetical protein